MRKILLVWLIIVIILAAQEQLKSEGKSYKGKQSRGKQSSTLGASDRDFSGESLFTGDVAFSVLITSIGGLQVALNYSSNVHKAVWASNAVQQSGWIGLGWSLQFGSIIADHNNTADESDDRYFYVDGNGSAELILESGSSYRLKDYKYWKITKHSGAFASGWEILREDGTIMRFGNYNHAAGSFVLDHGYQEATRFSLAWGGLISDPISTYYTSSDLGLVPYQWDLSEIEDIFGNYTTINYQQDKKNLTFGATSTTKQYSRASYPSSIVDPNGRSVVFTLANLTSAEYEAAPDETIQRYYQTQYLKEITINGSDGKVVQKFVLDHATADVLSIGQTKRYLTEITQQDASTPAKTLPSTKFEYFSVAGVASGVNNGALKKIIYPDGGEVEYGYSYQALSEVNLDRTDIYTPSLYPNINNLYGEFEGMGISGTDFRVVRLTDGNSDFIRVYSWGAKGWYEDSSFPISSSTEIEDYMVVNDYVVVRPTTTTMKIIKRKGDGWDTPYNVHDNLFVDEEVYIAGAGNDFFVVGHNKYMVGISYWNEQVSAIMFDDGNWSVDFIGNFPVTTNITQPPQPVNAACGNRFFVLRYGGLHDLAVVWSWDGAVWSESKSVFYPAGRQNIFSVAAGKDFFVTDNVGASPRSISAWRWNGTSWGTVKTFSNREADDGIRLGDHFFAIANVGKVYVYTKLADSNQWSELDASTKFSDVDSDGFKNGEIAVGRNLVAIGWRSESSPFQGRLGILKYNGTWSSQNLETIANFGDNNITPVNSAGVLYAELFKVSDYHKVKAYIDDGSSSWDNIEIVNVSNVPGSFTQPGANFVADVMNKDDGIAHSNKQGFGQNFDFIFTGNPGDYPVTSKVIRDGMGNAQTTTYAYTKGTYDPSLNFAKYNKVTVTPPGNNGYTETFFYNDLGAGDALEFVNVVNYQELDGLPYRVKVYDNATPTPNLTSETVNTWEAYTIDANDLIYHRRLEQTEFTLDGVTTTTTFTTNNTNGLTAKVTSTNTNGAIRIAKNTYAIEISDYSNGTNDMLDRNMLAQVAQQTVYETAEAATNARSSTVTTWREWPASSGKWAPEETYVWKEDDAANSLPTFNFTTPPGDNEWILASKVLNRDSFGRAYEVQDVNGTVTTTKRGYNNAVAMATIVNANDAEVVVEDFEDGDFDDSDPVDWYTSGSNWTITDGALNWTTTGASGLCTYPTSRDLTSFTAELDMKVPEGYTLNDWAAFQFRQTNVSDTPFTSGYMVYLRLNGSVELWRPTQGILGTYQSPKSGEVWHHIRIVVDNTDIDIYVDGVLGIQATDNTWSGSNTYFGFYAYRSKGYFDNIRLYPNDAFVTSQSYDPSTLQLIRSINENGVSTFYEYDSFQRPVRTINDDGHILSANATYFSRDGNGDSFSATDPNFNTSIVYNDISGFDDFSSSNGWTYSGDITFNQFVAGETTVRMGTFSGGWDYIYKSATGSNIAARVDFYPDNTTAGTPHVMAFHTDSPTNRFAIRYIPSTDRFEVQLQINGGGWTYPKTFSLDAPPNQWYTAEIIKTDDGRCFAWVYPRGAGRDYTDMYTTSGYPTGWQPQIRSWSNDDYFYLANFYAGSFIQTYTFTDGLGRPIQTQSWDADYDVISKTEYNSTGKVDKQYQPKRISNPAHTFYTGTTLFTEYEQFTYRGDPLARVEKQTHTSAANGEISFAYGAEQINGAGPVYAYRQVTDELGKIVKSYTDRFGNTVGTIGADGTGDEITARYEFDILGNTTTVKPPNEQASITGNWNFTSKYSTLGQVVEENNPDEDPMFTNGPTRRYVYDNMGNLRFSQDAGQFGTSQYDFTVYYYDAFGRVIQVGVEKDDFNWTDVSGAPSTSNTTYGTEANEWRIRYYYDENFVTGVANYCTGRLAKVEVNDDSDSAAEHTTKYVYDKFGNIVEKHITIDGGSPLSEQTIKHIYDHLGREIQTIYPSGNTVSRKYDTLGRLEKIFSIQ